MDSDMDRTTLFAIELYEIVAAIKNADHLRSMLGGRVVVHESRHEDYRSIELMILDDDGDTVDFAAYSDGPSGVVGIGGVASHGSVRLQMPQLYEGGVPVQDIDITRFIDRER